MNREKREDEGNGKIGEEAAVRECKEKRQSRTHETESKKETQGYIEAD